jgi:Reverse transcriptase (RNA-dependent DNA polymerase)
MLSESFCSFLAKIEKGSEPKNFEEAKLNDSWATAMDEELNALKSNQTWELIKLPNGAKIVGCHWIYKIKYKSDGTIERYKVWLVAKGYAQTFSIDYNETFAPVAKMNSIRTLMSVATNYDWSLYQMDVKNIFLHGDLEEEVYMDPSHGLSIENGLVCRFKKAIYGLKQSSCAWYEKLRSALLKIGFKRNEAESSMFVKTSNQGIVIILIYVDDLVIIGNDKVGMEHLKHHLGKEFDIKDLGNLKYFLDIEIARSRKGLFLSQRKYVLNLLKETGKLESKPANIPMNFSQKVTNSNEPLECQ